MGKRDLIFVLAFFVTALGLVVLAVWLFDIGKAAAFMLGMAAGWASPPLGLIAAMMTED